MSSGSTDTVISNGAEDIRDYNSHTAAVMLSEGQISVVGPSVAGGNKSEILRSAQNDNTSWTPDARVQKILNLRINSWRASIACAGFIRLSIFSRRSRSIAASSRRSRLPAFHFAYL